MQVNIPYMDGMGLPCVLFLFPGKATYRGCEKLMLAGLFSRNQVAPRKGKKKRPKFVVVKQLLTKRSNRFFGGGLPSVYNLIQAL